MKELSSHDVQKNFGAIADLVKAGESIRVTYDGQSAFMMIPETADTQELLRRLAGKRLARMLEESAPNAAARALTQQEVNGLIHACFT